MTVFKEAELIAGKLKISPFDYIEVAVKAFNRINKRNILRKQLRTESALVKDNSMAVLADFEMLYP